MCNHYENHAEYKQLKDHFELANLAEPLEGYEALVYPKYKTLIIKEGRRTAMASFGFGNPMLDGNKVVYNCRCESVATKPMFREAFKKSRCLLPANSFVAYSATKHKFRISLPDDQLFAFAGLYNAAGECTIITAPANSFLAKIHDRMPVILHPSDYDRWLTEGGTDLLVPYAGELKAVCIAEPKSKPEKKRAVVSEQRELF